MTGRSALIEVDSESLQGLDLLVGATARSMGHATFRLIATDENATTNDVAGRRVFLFFELLEGLCSVANLADQEGGTGLYSEPSILDRLQIASSPVVAIDAVDFVVGLLATGRTTLLLQLVRQGISKRKEWWSGSLDAATIPKTHAETIVAVHDARKTAAKADIAEIEAARAREEKSYRDAVRQRVADFTGTDIVNPRLIDALIDSEVLPAIRSPGGAGIVAVAPLFVVWFVVEDGESSEGDVS